MLKKIRMYHMIGTMAEKSGETILETGPEMSLPASFQMPRPYAYARPILPPQLPPPSIYADRAYRYMQGVPQGVPHPHYYYGKPLGAESEDQPDASIRACHKTESTTPTISIPPNDMPWLIPPHYAFIPKEEEKKILWPEGLLREEMERLRELGLGKVIDATLPNPWADKKAYQAKEVRLQALVVTNEGNRIKRFEEEIESYYEVQGRIEVTVKYPDKPIDTSVAAESHRSHNTSYSMKGTTILTRTISFGIGPPHCEVCADDVGDKTPDVLVDTRTSFEKQLDQWVKARSEEGDLEADQEYDDKTNAYCREFLESLGGATHYVSSITLGAMSYKVKTSSSSVTMISQQSTIKVPRAGGTTTSTKVKTGSSRKRSDEQEIGQIPDGGIIKIRSPAEAVIRYSFSPLTNLVSNLELRAHLQRAIQQYFESFKKRGPFRIMSAEAIKIDGKDSLVYWKAKPGQRDEDASASKYKYEIVGTVNPKEASNFFIHPDISDKSERWFFITTDPEEKHTQVNPNALPRQSMVDSTLPTVLENSVALGVEGTSIKTTSLVRANAKPDISDVERYVHTRLRDGSLILEARSIVDKRFARFKIVDRMQHTSVPLKASSWLPRTQLGSTLVLPGDPYFIQPAFTPKTFIRKHCLALHVSETPQLARVQSIFHHANHDETPRSNKQPKYQYSFELKRHQKEHKLGAHMMLFALVKGKHT